MENFAISFGASIFLFVVASGIHVMCKKFKIPYTTTLFIAGLLLAQIASLPAFHFLQAFTLTPELLFYVFLPILVFESGYSMQRKDLTRNATYIWGLAIGGVLLTATVVGIGGHYAFKLFGIHIPITITFLFGALIAATDPVSILALFKELGAPKRLTLLFEAESLFNDGTSLALFFIVFHAIQTINKTGFFDNAIIGIGILNFALMIGGGIILGFLLGILFSHVIKKINNNEQVEIGLTLVLGFLTFIVSEVISKHVVIAGFAIKISGIIATAYAAIVMGNYGKTKISPKVEQHMGMFRGFFAHMVNSLVFLLMGLMLKNLNVNLLTFLPYIAIAIGVTTVARMVSVYLPIGILNKLCKKDKKVPLTRQHLLAWGDLKGALVIMMVVFIPNDFTVGNRTHDFSVKQFLLAITVGYVIYTLFVKGLSIPFLLKKYKITTPTSIEDIGQNQATILMCLEVMNKLATIHRKGYITQEEYKDLHEIYQTKMQNALEKIKKILEKMEESDRKKFIHKTLSLYALGIERQTLKDLFAYNQIDESLYRELLHKLDKQTARIEQGLPQIKSPEEKHYDEDYDILDKINTLFAANKKEAKYIKNRTKRIIAGKVIKELTLLKEKLSCYEESNFDEVIELYKKFHTMADMKCSFFYEQDKKYFSKVNETLTNKKLIQLEEKIAKELLEKEMISPKIYQTFIEQLEEEIAKNHVCV